MATKNICDVEILESATENTNAIVEDNGVLHKVNFADSIIKQGTEGIWTYRQWFSGISECWGVLKIEQHKVGEGSSTIYYNEETSKGQTDTNYCKFQCPFPSDLFVSDPDKTPLVMVTGVDVGKGVLTTSVDATDISNTSCYLIMWGNKEAFGSINVLALGRWK